MILIISSWLVFNFKTLYVLNDPPSLKTSTLPLCPPTPAPTSPHAAPTTAFKMTIITLRVLLVSRGRAQHFNLSLTHFLCILFFPSLYDWTDGWPNAVTPTTPPRLNISHPVESTLQCSLSLCFCKIFCLGHKCAYYHTPLPCFILFYFSILQLTYVVKMFDNTQPLKCLLQQRSTFLFFSLSPLLPPLYQAPIVSAHQSGANTAPPLLSPTFYILLPLSNR